LRCQEIALLLVISFQDNSVAGLDYGFEELHGSFRADDFPFPEGLLHFGELAFSNSMFIEHKIGSLNASGFMGHNSLMLCLFFSLS
jgi:hypothetical protein